MIANVNALKAARNQPDSVENALGPNPQLKVIQALKVEIKRLQSRVEVCHNLEFFPVTNPPSPLDSLRSWPKRSHEREIWDEGQPV